MNEEEQTPEYIEAYDKAMEELNNSAVNTDGKEAESESKTADTTDQDSVVVEKEAPAVDTDTPAVDDVQAKIAEMERQISSTGKALEDTKKWGHGLSKKVKELTQKLETATKAERPALLDQVEGLQDAIDYAVKAAIPTHEEEVDFPISSEQPKNSWAETVSAALPDMEDMLNDPELHAKAKALQTKYGDQWSNDPLFAIRYLSNLRTEHLTTKAVREALAATSAKQIESQQRKDSMRVPSGNGSKAGRSGTIDLVNDAEAVRNLSHDQFTKLRSKTLGY